MQILRGAVSHLSLCLIAIAMVPAQKSFAQSFNQTCSSPSFPSPTATAIDSACGVSGSGGVESSQNEAKNNFCANGTPTSMTVDDSAKLQITVTNDRSINFGDENTALRKKGPTTNRVPLEKLGEGRLVVLQGFVLKARQEGGESVNCGKNVPNRSEYHDIHISVVSDAATKDECAGVVVEMSPHHRPDVWNIQTMEKVAGSGVPVRVTGQLFFDSSHVPCERDQGVRSNPKRVSLWEVHPIYSFELCTADCTGTGTWESLEQWSKTH
ncbi:MAG: hypothetical protein WCA27_05540 [Candidatus Sulfotelmatobacter sp.]